MTENNRSMPFNIKLAGIVIRIEPMYDYIHEYCREYMVDEPECFIVRTEPEDIVYERERSARENIREESCRKEFLDAYLETLAVYRKIAERMPFSDTVLFHGSVISVDEEGYLFTAKSGTGKSTHTRLWRECCGSRAVMVNDDKPLLKVDKNRIIAYGTPWNGKHRLSTNMAVPLKAICILTRDKDNHIEEINPVEAYKMLLQQSYRPADRTAFEQTLKLIDELMKNTRFYRLGCNMEPEAAMVAYNGMKGDRK